MEKLQLKHLAPYLHLRINPLKLQYENGIHTLDGLSGAWNVDLRQAMRVIENVHVESVKPYLRPLSELLAYNEITGNPFYKDVLKECHPSFNGNNNRFWITEIKNEFLKIENKYNDYSFSIWLLNADLDCYENKELTTFNDMFKWYQELFRYHFDVFNLIEQGLAFDIKLIS